MLRAATGHVASQRVAEKTGFTVPRIIGPNITMPVGTRVVPLPEGDRYASNCGKSAPFGVGS